MVPNQVTRKKVSSIVCLPTSTHSRFVFLYCFSLWEASDICGKKVQGNGTVWSRWITEGIAWDVVGVVSSTDCLMIIIMITSLNSSNLICMDHPCLQELTLLRTRRLLKRWLQLERFYLQTHHLPQLVMNPSQTRGCLRCNALIIMIIWFLLYVHWI